jgi:hypothetical protein
VKTKSVLIRSFIIIFLVLMVGIQPISTASAFSSGTTYPTTGASVTAGTGTVAWTNPGRIVLNDNSYASVRLTSSGQYSQYLQATNFGFAIPGDATITSIVVEIGRYQANYTGVTARIRDESIKLIKGGNIVGDDNADRVTVWPLNNEGIATYSPANPLWGTTWTPAEINASGFGVNLQAVNPGTTGSIKDGFVDYIRVTVSYTRATTVSSVSAVADTYGNTVSLTATLTHSTLGPLSGKDIDFTLNGETACTGTTNASGVATCNAELLINVGSYADGVEAIFAGDSDYTASNATNSLTVDQRPITITAAADTKIYDGTTDSDEAPIQTGTLATGDSVDWTQSFDDRDVGTGKTLTPSGTIEDGNGGANYDVSIITATGNITALEITVSAVTDTKIYDGTTDSDEEPNLSVPLGFGDTHNFSQSFDDRDAGSSKTLSPTGSIDDGNDGNNYDVSFVDDVTGEITVRPIEVSADAKSRTYGDPDPTLTYQITSGSLVGGDEFTGSLSREAGEDAGSYEILQNDLALSTNYDLSYVGADFSITVRPITVTADPQSKILGQDDPVLTYQITSGSLVLGDAFSGELTREPGEEEGTYTILQGTLLLSDNYDLTYVVDYLTINPLLRFFLPLIGVMRG